MERIMTAIELRTKSSTILYGSFELYGIMVVHHITIFSVDSRRWKIVVVSHDIVTTDVICIYIYTITF